MTSHRSSAQRLQTSGEVIAARGRTGITKHSLWSGRAVKVGAAGVVGLSLLAAAPLRAQDAPRVVTLITGDRVMLSGKHGEVVSVLPAAGRETMNFVTERVELRPGEGRHLLVFPEDALAPIAADELDRELFDVTALLAYGYDDARRGDLPVIFSYAAPSGSASATAGSSRALPGAVFQRDLPSIHAVAAAASKQQMGQLWSALRALRAGGASAAAAAGDPIRKVWLDRRLLPVLDRSVPQIGAPAAWALGYDGTGVAVAVIDDGVDVSHPDLIDRVVVTRNFTEGPDLDESGHGTHVASIIAGTGAAGGGRYRGVAPGAEIISGKVCDSGGCPESAIIEGVEWAVVEEGARIVSISLGGLDTADVDPLEQALLTLHDDYDALFVVAAGNSGPGAGSVESPGSVEVALTVGAVDRADAIADFSSRGPVNGVGIKPDVMAPGVSIVAARAAGISIGEVVDEWYTALDGTSMATPHVSGAAALLLQQHPDWGASELKRALMSSASAASVESVLEQGTGRVDVAAALELSFMADTSGVELGVARWPHDDDPVLSRVVSYRNLGAASELRFDLDVRGPDGSLAPAGMFTVTPATASVAEGGTVSVTIEADTSLPGLDGVYGGRLIASSGSGPDVVLPLLVQREVESYDLTLRVLDRGGSPTSDFSGFIVGRDSAFFLSVAVPATPGDVSVRLPKGHYFVETNLPSAGNAEPASFLFAPNQQVDADRLLVFDARDAAVVSAQPPSPNATFANFVLFVQSPGLDQARVVRGAPEFYTALVGSPEPEFFSGLTAEWLDASTSPTSRYAGSWSSHGAMPAGVKVMDAGAFATVHATYAAPLPVQEFNYLALGAAPKNRTSDSVVLFFDSPLELPLERTEYFYAADDEIRWYRGLTMFGTGISSLGTPPTPHAAGQVESHAWNEAPFSPLWVEENGPSGAFRQGDTLVLAPAMYSDGDGYFYILAQQARSTLYRDGEVIAQTEAAGGEFQVAPEPAAYRLEVHHSQSTFHQSISQDVAWSFRSAHVDGDDPEALPLLAVDFERPVAAQPPHAGCALRLPFGVTQYGRTTPPDMANITLAASYDDGATWIKAPVQRDAAGWSAALEPPPGVEFVSLRASAVDVDGNAVEQTAIRAVSLAQPSPGPLSFEQPLLEQLSPAQPSSGQPSLEAPEHAAL